MRRSFDLWFIVHNARVWSYDWYTWREWIEWDNRKTISARQIYLENDLSRSRIILILKYWILILKFSLNIYHHLSFSHSIFFIKLYFLCSIFYYPWNLPLNFYSFDFFSYLFFETNSPSPKIRNKYLRGRSTPTFFLIYLSSCPTSKGWTC